MHIGVVLQAPFCTHDRMKFLVDDPMNVVWCGRGHVGGSKFRDVVGGRVEVCVWLSRLVE